MVTKWLAALRKRNAEEAFTRGFDWCAGELLRGKSRDELEQALDFTFDSTAFDYGAQAALQQWDARATIDKAELDTLVYNARGGCSC